MALVNNNRKTTHRRSNGKIVIVRHHQYPTKANTKTRKYSFKGSIREHTGCLKSMIRHNSPLVRVISGRGDREYSENQPKKVH